MKVGVGGTVIIKNSRTRQYGYYHIHEMFARGPAYILYGTLGGHDLWLPALADSRPTVKARASCVVWVPGMVAEVIERLVQMMSGRPLYFVESPSAAVGEPILNKDYIPHSVARDARDAMLQRAVVLVDAFSDFRATGELAPWCKTLKDGPT